MIVERVIPDEFYLGANRWRVRPISGKLLTSRYGTAADKKKGRPIFGVTIFAKRLIQLRRESTPDEKYLTFLHELEHAYDAERGVHRTEEEVDIAAALRLQYETSATTGVKHNA